MKTFSAIDIILVSYERLNFLRRVVNSIKERTFYPHRLIVVDNCSGREVLDYLKRMEKIGKIDKLVYLPKNLGQAEAQNEGFKLVSSEYFVITQNDLLPPDLKPCWLERLKRLMDKHQDYGAICMRIQRTRRLEWNEEDDIIENFKSMPAVFRMHRTEEIRSLGERPFGTRKHWESHTFAQISKMMLKKKFGMATHLYANHLGFMANNKGYADGFTDYFTYSPENPYVNTTVYFDGTCVAVEQALNGLGTPTMQAVRMISPQLSMQLLNVAARMTLVFILISHCLGCHCQETSC